MQNKFPALLCLVMFAVFVLFAATANGEYVVTLGCPVQTNASADSVAVPIYLTNSGPIGGYSLGFCYNSDDVYISSMSLVGSVIDSISQANGQLLLDPANRRALTGWIDINAQHPIQPQSGGLLATIWFRIRPGAANQEIDIDSCFVPPAGYFAMAYAAEPLIFPQFQDCGTADLIISDFVCGDVDGSGKLDILDIVATIKWIFANGPEPVNAALADVNCNGKTNIGDLVLMALYIFGFGPSPCSHCR